MSLSFWFHQNSSSMHFNLGQHTKKLSSNFKFTSLSLFISNNAFFNLVILSCSSLLNVMIWPKNRHSHNWPFNLHLDSWKSRSASNLRKISGTSNLDFLSPPTKMIQKKLDLYRKPKKKYRWQTEKKFRCAGPKIFVRFETDLNFSRPWFWNQGTD